MERLLGEMKGIVGRATAALAAERAEGGGGEREPAASLAQRAPDAEMADALAAAVERLRARAQASPPRPEQDAPQAEVDPPTPAVKRPAHKHSLSLIGRIRNRRKQRRSR